jgi:TonB family protein
MKILRLPLVLAVCSICCAQQAQEMPANPTSPAPALKPGESSCRSHAAVGNVVTGDSKISQGLLIHKVAPSYPKAARKAHIQGTVLLCAYISEEGEVKDLEVVSGPPELIPSALGAVRQWRYKPYLADGKPAAVETEIRVNYTLDR